METITSQETSPTKNKVTLTIHHDSDAQNPWESWDGLPGLYYQGNRDYENTFYNLDIHTEDTIETIKNLCDLANIQYYQWTSRGYSQGDCLECILVATPEYLETTGIKKDTATIRESLEQDAKLWDAYTWGDVYGYKLTESIPLYHEDGTLSEETEDNIIDSCWGFYNLNDIKDAIPEEYRNQFETAKDNIIF